MSDNIRRTKHLTEAQLRLRKHLLRLLLELRSYKLSKAVPDLVQHKRKKNSP
jgi:hypothetical protein